MGPDIGPVFPLGPGMGPIVPLGPGMRPIVPLGPGMAPIFKATLGVVIDPMDIDVKGAPIETKEPLCPFICFMEPFGPAMFPVIPCIWGV